ncbi:ribosome-associated protein [Chitinivorax tropicus]|uniref:Ribosomal silencing factor RsfS n=1 Tax=Chitinivorax tropicus TaxID=714531 RepID=A0A840MMP4_9PROT|nr:ribosome silencing factor [Chitinivorax tropicus]MBB5018389.1 ribosome-associated protein [Chitinivorax tropicus]
MNTEDLKKIAIAALEDVKAKDIVVLDVSKLTSMFEWLVVASGDSNRQVKALANNVREEIKEAGGEVLSVEGEQSGEWVLVDLGSIVVHVMQPAVRDYYNLEALWGGQKPVYVPKTAVWQHAE